MNLNILYPGYTEEATEGFIHTIQKRRLDALMDTITMQSWFVDPYTYRTRVSHIPGDYSSWALWEASLPQ